MSICFYCESKDGNTEDHIVPRSLGGKRRSNLVSACQYCNTTKGSMEQQDFIKFLEFLSSKQTNLRDANRGGHLYNLKKSFLKQTGIKVGVAK